jgi:hypothetical protein
VSIKASWWGLVVALSAVGAAQAQTPANTQREIASLLESVGSSGCGFYRNGTWYTAKQAQKHLQMKYAGLSGGEGVATTEDFIARIATRSSLSGRSYRIRCAGAVESDTASWFLEQLIRYRKGAAGVSQPAPLDGSPDQPATLSRPS